MPVFISHSHQDKTFVDQLAAQLILHKAYIWLDRWEIKVGDSLIDKIQGAIKSASALIVVLSKASVASEWCRKELNAGLIRELEERKVIVLPLLVEDCEMPLFLKEKKYADFRTNFDTGLDETLTAISVVTSGTQGRIEQPNFHTDFGIAWGYIDALYWLDLRFIDHGEAISYSVLTEIKIICNEALSERIKSYESMGLASLGRLILVTTLNQIIKKEESSPFVLEGSLPTARTMVFDHPKKGFSFEIMITAMRLGQDTGMDTVLDWPRHVEQTWNDMMGEVKPEDRQRARELLTE